MSSGPMPPNNPYGDRDFNTDGNPNSVNRNAGLYGNLNQPPIAQPTLNPYNPALNDPQAQFKFMNQSITQEDMLFMRSYRRDTFYGKTLPFFTLSSGALYLYRRNKGLKQNWWHYLVLGVVANVTGPFLNRHEFLRRLEREPGNTPFLEALRKMFGVTRPFSEMDREAGGQVESAAELTDSSAPVLDFNSPKYGSEFSPVTSFPPTESEIHDPPSAKKPVSYDELRARNRGFSR